MVITFIVLNTTKKIETILILCIDIIIIFIPDKLFIIFKCCDDRSNECINFNIMDVFLLYV